MVISFWVFFLYFFLLSWNSWAHSNSRAFLLKDSFSPSLFLPTFSPHYINLPFLSKKVLLVEGAHIFLFYSRLTSQIKNLMFSNFLRLTFLATHSNMFKGENLVLSNPFLSGNFGASAYLKNTLHCSARGPNRIKLHQQSCKHGCSLPVPDIKYGAFHKITTQLRSSL